MATGVYMSDTNFTDKVRWRDDSRTTIMCVIEDWMGWEGVIKIVELEFKLLDEVDHRVSIIFDIRSVTRVPPDALSYIQRLVQMQHPNEGLNIFVGMPLIAETLFTVIGKVYREIFDNYRFVGKMDEALRLADEYAQWQSGLASQTNGVGDKPDA